MQRRAGAVVLRDGSVKQRDQLLGQALIGHEKAGKSDRRGSREW
jgi:hypothetical protein